MTRGSGISRRPVLGRIESAWALRTQAGLVYLVVFYVWIVSMLGMFDSPRTAAWHEFWTATSRGGFSLLGICLTIKILWAAVSATECVYCCFDRAAPLRGIRIFLHAILAGLFLFYAYAVHYWAMSAVSSGPI